jgi:SMODS-associating 2TM, beta-strand rich effector domain
MNRRILVQVIAFIVVTVFAAGIWFTGGTLDLQWLRFFSASVFISVSVLTIWENWAWHLPLVQNLPQVPRDLRGTWKGTLESFWINPETGLSPPIKDAYLVIRQSKTTISVVLLTNESKSKSSLAMISDDGVSASLDYMYLNRPDSRYEYRSRMHHGSTSLDITGKPAVRLQGRYWTSRDSRGELDFNQRKMKFADDFLQAETLFNPRRHN